jgi:hypothetical protein
MTIQEVARAINRTHSGTQLQPVKVDHGAPRVIEAESEMLPAKGVASRWFLRYL